MLRNEIWVKNIYRCASEKEAFNQFKNDIKYDPLASYVVKTTYNEEGVVFGIFTIV